MATPNFIAGYSSGLINDKKPVWLPDQAFSKLENAYVWRERVKKREGKKLLGRLERVLTEKTLPVTGAANTYVLVDILTSLGLRATEPDAEIRPSTITITIDSAGVNKTVIVDTLGTGVLSVGAPNALSFTTGKINYISGALTLNFTAPIPAGLTVEITMHYFPALPVMGIWQRETSTAINQEQSIFFDTKYAYINTGQNSFNEFLPLENVTWAGSDSDFFWAANYRGIEPGDRLFFVTNFVNDAADPIRWTDGTQWENFSPALAATTITGEAVGTVVFPWTTFSGTLLNLPISRGSVVITVGAITFTDVNVDGTLTGSPASNTGTIDYSTGNITLNFSPALAMDTAVTADYDQATNTLFQARILIPYYGRLLALNVWEGATIATSKHIANRCRFSETGNPLNADAWRTDIFGRGGFIDAPVNEDIVSATFFKNTLIVGFERSTWQLRYVGEYGLPFIWERISSDFGCGSTFSGILFDEGVLLVGDRAIISATAVTAKRIDEQIPDVAFDIQNIENGSKRVHGARDFRKELVYWCYPLAGEENKFPDTVLVYNYRNGCYAQFRDTVTCFGTFQPPDSINWDRDDIFWDQSDVTWDSSDNQNFFPFVVSGNQQGFIHYYAFSLPDEESLAIKNVNITVSPNVITSVNHNLTTGEIIKIAGIMYDSPASEDLNDRIFRVTKLTNDTFEILEWDGDNYVNTPVGTQGTYIGGGTIILIPVMKIETKDFNPYQTQGQQAKFIYIDFLTDATENSQVSVNLFGNSSMAVQGNMIVGNHGVETSLPAPYYPPGSDYAWHRFFATFAAQYIRVQITYNDDLMNVPETHENEYIQNAMVIWTRQAGKVIF